MLQSANIKISNKGLFLVSVPLFLNTIIVLVLIGMLCESGQQAQREVEASTMLLQVESVGSLIRDGLAFIATQVTSTGAVRINKLLARTSEPPRQFKDLDPSSKLNTIDSLADKEHLGSGSEKYWSETVRRAFNVGMIIDESLHDREKAPSENWVLDIVGIKRQVFSLMDQEERTRDALVRELEEQGHQSQSNSRSWREQILALLALGLLLNVILSLFLARFYSKSIINRLNVLLDNSARLPMRTALAPRLSGSDEIGYLDAIFHSMAEKLEESARKEKAVIDNAIDVICSIDEQGNFTAINAASRKIWGYEPEELAGKSLPQLIVPEDIEEMIETIRSPLSNDVSAVCENRVVCKNGSIVDMLWSLRWSEQENQYFCVAHDTTERKLSAALLKESEERSQMILESMPVGLVITNGTGTIEVTNASAEHMFGYKAADLSGKDLQSIFHTVADTELGTNQAVAEMLNAIELSLPGKPGKSIELVGLRKNGSTFPVELTLVNMLVQDERKPMAIIADITPRKEIERLKRDFVAMVSHDLRTPLTAIQTTMEFLENSAYGVLNQEGENAIATTSSEVYRVIELVNGLLDMEKLESGLSSIEKAKVSLDSVLMRSIASVKLLAEHNETTLVSDTIACQVEMDSSRIVQVLVNLISNAIKFSPQHSTITISASEIPFGVEVRVQDEGRGVPESERGAIFERFKQVEVTDRTVKKGAGLGLAICKSIITAHGGTIGVQSNPGKGSTFWFHLPAEHGSRT